MEAHEFALSCLAPLDPVNTLSQPITRDFLDSLAALEDAPSDFPLLSIEASIDPPLFTSLDRSHAFAAMYNSGASSAVPLVESSVVPSGIATVIPTSLLVSPLACTQAVSEVASYDKGKQVMDDIGSELVLAGKPKIFDHLILPSAVPTLPQLTLGPRCHYKKIDF